ncbi:hypothetical protein CSB20_05840 [bacterium DOLZORAL124_64_63]|nr:MAG: hypothetical protein CSB20_05840 [bacterium DOLZORAL124_64_63]
MFSRTPGKRPVGRNYPANRRARDRNRLIVFVAAVGLVLLLMAQLGEDGLATLLKLRNQETELTGIVQRLEKDNADLEEKLHGLATDPAVLEKRAREEHNMQKPGEEVLTVRQGEEPER